MTEEKLIYRDRNFREITSGFYLDSDNQVCYVMPLNNEALLITNSLSKEEQRIDQSNRTFASAAYIDKLVPITHLDYLDRLTRETHFIISQLNRLEKIVRESKLNQLQSSQEPKESKTIPNSEEAPFCTICGHLTVRNGTCYKCLNCGNSE